jgi:hypothetical protein
MSPPISSKSKPLFYDKAVNPPLLNLILSHIFLTDPISMKCQEILQRKISQAAPEERGVLRGTGEKP